MTQAKDLVSTSVSEILGGVLLNEPMSKHTSFKIGGAADYFAVVANESDLRALLQWAQSTRTSVFFLGAGTNLLVSDKGVRGLVIQLGAGFRKVRVEGEKVVAGAGVKLSALLRRTLGLGLSGIEGLAGVPGTVGGAICMNAGTHAGCVGDVLKNVRVIDSDGNVVELSAEEMGLRYRQSNVRGKGIIILDAMFELIPKGSDEIDRIVSDLISRRKSTQPPGGGTAGSVFKNPENGHAGRMLEEVGAKGIQVGGARVSIKHANFIVNTGNATAADVRELMCVLIGMVKEKFGIVLEPEIQLVGEW